MILLYRIDSNRFWERLFCGRGPPPSLEKSQIEKITPPAKKKILKSKKILGYRVQLPSPQVPLEVYLLVFNIHIDGIR